MSEKIPSTGGTKPAAAPAPLPSSAGSANAGGVGGDKNPAGTAATPPGGTIPPHQSPAAFGGHKGGGKKRTDGLIAGSPEAEKVDRDNNALRMFLNRQESNPSPHFATEFAARLQGILPIHRQKFQERAKEISAKSPALPAALPGKANPAGDAPVSMAAGEPDLSVPVVGIAGSDPAVLAPTFVPWSEKVIGRVVKVFTKIVDRIRVGKLMQRIRSLGFTPEVEKEAEARLAYKAEQINDFNAALTNCAVTEANKRRVPGAQHSHWIELALVSGELVNSHMDNVDWLEQKLLEKAEREKSPKP